MSMAPVALMANVDTTLQKTTDPVVRVQGLSKSFAVRRSWGEMLRALRGGSSVYALRDVTCDIYPGEFFGLLGQNGAGKTTLFKILATLITPDTGTAQVAGYDVTRHAAEVRQVLTPVIANERSLNWRLSAYENLRLYAALHGLSPSAGESRITEMLEVVQLVDVGEKTVGAFSSGMKQRLLIARALLARPEVLLLDEPTRSLDPISARTFRRFLREEIVQRLGCTVMLATHDADEVFELCDRVGVLHQGRLLTVEGTEQLVNRVSEPRYQVWLKSPRHPALAELVRDQHVAHMTVLAGDIEGWSRVELEIRGGVDGAAFVLTTLHHAAIEVARFERVAVSLADVIERVVSSLGHEEHGN